MKTRNHIILATFLFVIITFSCDRDKPDPECKDASCCDPRVNEFVEYIVDVPAHLGGPPQYSTWGFAVTHNYPTGKEYKYQSSVLSICVECMDKIAGFTPDLVPRDSADMTYPYLISGKVLANVVDPRLRTNPILSIYLDKVIKK